jgi:small conductance mechanosensitive channel
MRGFTWLMCGIVLATFLAVSGSSMPLAAQDDAIGEQIDRLNSLQSQLKGLQQSIGNAAAGGGDQQTSAPGFLDSLKSGNLQSAGSIMLALFLQIAVKISTFASVFFGFWVLAGIVRRMIIRAGRLNAVDHELAGFMGRVARTALLIVGAICGVATMGIDVTALIAGLGLTGFALGFALKDVVSNVVAGVLILIYRPVRTGEHVKVKAFEGLILSTDLRYTVLQTGDQVIYVPNSIMFTDAITVDRRQEMPEPDEVIAAEPVVPDDVVPLKSDQNLPDAN